MVKQQKIFMILVVLLFAFCLNASEKISLAVYDFNANEVKPVLADSVADFIQTSLYTTGRFNLVERKNIGKILKEQAFQKTGCTSTECAVEVGRILNVSNIITGTLSKTGQMFVISIQLVNVEESRIVLTAKVECDSEDLLNDAATKLARHFAKGVAIKGKVVKILNENEIIVNLGLQDGIAKDQELEIERLGESVKDEAGTIIYQKRKPIAKVRTMDVSEAASNVKAISKNEDIKEGDVIEIKKEILVQLEPLRKTVEPSKPAAGYTYFDIFGLFEPAVDFTRDNAKIGTTEPFSSFGVSYGGNLLGGDLKWLADVYGEAVISAQSKTKDLTGRIQDGANASVIAGTLGFRFYPLTTLINPGYTAIKDLKAQRGFLAPYLSVEASIYVISFRTGNLVATKEDSATVITPGFNAKLGIDIANLVFIEIFHRASVNSEFIYEMNLGTGPSLKSPIGPKLDNDFGIGAGFRF